MTPTDTLLYDLKQVSINLFMTDHTYIRRIYTTQYIVEYILLWKYTNSIR